MYGACHKYHQTPWTSLYYQLHQIPYHLAVKITFWLRIAVISMLWVYVDSCIYLRIKSNQGGHLWTQKLPFQCTLQLVDFQLFISISNYWRILKLTFVLICSGYGPIQGLIFSSWQSSGVRMGTGRGKKDPQGEILGKTKVKPFDTVPDWGWRLGASCYSFNYVFLDLYDSEIKLCWFSLQKI